MTVFSYRDPEFVMVFGKTSDGKAVFTLTAVDLQDDGELVGDEDTVITMRVREETLLKLQRKLGSRPWILVPSEPSEDDDMNDQLRTLFPDGR